jgi:hypothetical protein
MIHPAPTTKIDPTLCRGVLEHVENTAAGSPQIVIEIPNSSYRMAFNAVRSVRAEVGKRIIGRVTLKARRVDIVDTGGKFVEPVFGRPRRVQGRVLGADGGRNALVVDAGFPIHCELTDVRQCPEDFPVGELVSFDALDGAVFEEL